MARKKLTEPTKHTMNPNVEGLHAEILEQPICDTLELNYMPYAMSVIVSRAIPEIDGFKPSHRKLLYTMYKMGLLNGGRTRFLPEARICLPEAAFSLESPVRISSRQRKVPTGRLLHL